MTKVILFDADGVVIKDHEYFSIRYTNEFGIDLDESSITDFFKGDYKLSAVGKADLKEQLEARLEEWGWKGTVDELINYWFEGEREVNEQILELIQMLKTEGYKSYLASDNEAYRAKYLLDTVGLDKNFEETFFSCFLGYTKSEPDFFEHIIQKLEVSPEEVIYIDDDAKNVAVATKIGIDSIHYTDFVTLKKTLKEKLAL